MLIRINFLLYALLIFFSVSSVSAKSPVQAAADALSMKLKKDLALEKVTVKFSQVKTYHLARGLIGLRGSGKANELDINFDVKLNKNKLVPTEVEYRLLEPNPASAFSDEALTRDLLAELNKAFKTDNLVVAVDYFDIERLGNEKMKITGNGELRIDFEWRKVKFEILKTATFGLPVTVKYQIY